MFFCVSSFFSSKVRPILAGQKDHDSMCFLWWGLMNVYDSNVIFFDICVLIKKLADAMYIMYLFIGSTYIVACVFVYCFRLCNGLCICLLHQPILWYMYFLSASAYGMAHAVAYVFPYCISLCSDPCICLLYQYIQWHIHFLIVSVYTMICAFS